MTTIQIACSEVVEEEVERILDEMLAENKFQNMDDFEEAIDQRFNGHKTFSGETDYCEDLFSHQDPVKTIIMNTFNMIKSVTVHCREIYGYEYEIKTLNDIVDLYAYFFAKDIMYDKFESYEEEEDEEDADEDYTRHNDEDDTELPRQQ
jgi:hypothetical protein